MCSRRSVWQAESHVICSVLFWSGVDWLMRGSAWVVPGCSTARYAARHEGSVCIASAVFVIGLRPVTTITPIAERRFLAEFQQAPSCISQACTQHTVAPGHGGTSCEPSSCSPRPPGGKALPSALSGAARIHSLSIREACPPTSLAAECGLSMSCGQGVDGQHASRQK